MDAKIPIYAQALEALKRGDDDMLVSATLRFESGDVEYVLRVADAIRTLLLRTEITPQQIVSIGRALHGLRRLPLRTPGLDIEISLFSKMEGGAASYDFTLDVDSLETSSGGYTNFGYGSDSWSGPTFLVDTGGREDEPNGRIFESWPDIFGEASGNDLKITDLSDESLLDWEHPDGSAFWEWIDKKR